MNWLKINARVPFSQHLLPDPSRFRSRVMRGYLFTLGLLYRVFSVVTGMQMLEGSHPILHLWSGLLKPNKFTLPSLLIR